MIELYNDILKSTTAIVVSPHNEIIIEPTEQTKTGTITPWWHTVEPPVEDDMGDQQVEQKQLRGAAVWLQTWPPFSSTALWSQQDGLPAFRINTHTHTHTHTQTHTTESSQAHKHSHTTSAAAGCAAPALPTITPSNKPVWRFLFASYSQNLVQW